MEKTNEPEKKTSITEFVGAVVIAFVVVNILGFAFAAGAHLYDVWLGTELQVLCPHGYLLDALKTDDLKCSIGTCDYLIACVKYD
jgi:hypothetical protein